MPIPEPVTLAHDQPVQSHSAPKSEPYKLNRSPAYKAASFSDANPLLSHLHLSLMSFALYVQTDGVTSDERTHLITLGELLHDIAIGKQGAASQLCTVTSELLLSMLAAAHISHWCVSPEHLSKSRDRPDPNIPIGKSPRDSITTKDKVFYFPDMSWQADNRGEGLCENYAPSVGGMGPASDLQKLEQRLGDYDQCAHEVERHSSIGTDESQNALVNLSLMEALGLEESDWADMVPYEPRQSHQTHVSFNSQSIQDTIRRRLSYPSRMEGSTDDFGANPSPLSVGSRTRTGLVRASRFARHGSMDSCQEWQETLMGIFWELDGDGSGDVSNMELRNALTTVGVTPARSMKMLQLIDKDGDGNISQEEWEDVITALGRRDAPHLIKDFMKALIKHISRHGALYSTRDPDAQVCFLKYNSNFRTCWDILMTSFLFYVAIALPFTLAFEDKMSRSISQTFSNVEISVDGFFVMDIVLNFRTSYISSDGKHITNPRQVCCNYLRTWFLVDFISSVPVDKFLNMLPDLNWVKLLKLGKIAKALKVLRVGRVFRRVDLIEVLDELVNGSTFIFKILSLAITTACMCHWMACFFVAFGGEQAFENYFDVIQSIERQYLASLYWAFSTMTTVGYGDVIPKSDGERVFACFAMIIGGGFYGYVIGNITSLVSTKDANLRAYHEKMNLVQAWLTYHNELPPNLVRRIRRHFKDLLTAKTAIGDSEILHDLSPDLRCDVSNFIIHDDVRYNVLFEDLPSTALALLVPSLQTTSVEVGEAVVRENEPGVAMFIILAGTGSFTSIAEGCSKQLGVGDSFGEEVILALELRYQYTVTATSKMNLHMIPAMAFNACFQAMPDLVSQMRTNFLRARKFLSGPERTEPARHLHGAEIMTKMRNLNGSGFRGHASLEGLSSSMEELLQMVHRLMQVQQPAQVHRPMQVQQPAQAVPVLRVSTNENECD